MTRTRAVKNGLGSGIIAIIFSVGLGIILAAFGKML